MKKRICRTAGAIAAAAVFAVSFIVPPTECAYGAEGYENVAGSSEMAAVKDVGKYGMTPISADSIKEGDYKVKTETSSSFFSVYECALTVKKDSMSAVLTINSISYECVYMGKAADAAKAPKSDYIFAEEKDARGSFTIPIEALNTPIACAAFSKKEKQWYDRNILIDASSLPKDALKIKLPDYDLIDKAVKQYDAKKGTGGESQKPAAPKEKENKISALVPADVKMDNGEYSIEVNMTGGSGRASVSSPTWFYVRNGKAYAKLLWSSAHYDYMKLNGVKYENETKDGGNSTFTIPVAAFDQPISIIADTTAMGDPLEIAYQLTFYKDTIGSVTKVPQEAAKRVIYIALAIIVVGGALNLFVKRRKKQ